MYFVVPPAIRNLTLLVSSLVFYAWGAGGFVLYLLLSVLVNFFLGLLADKVANHSETRVRLWVPVSLSVICNLSMLGYFKYANFFVDQMNFLLLLGEHDAILWSEVILPIGISFFTFQSMSYTFDIARGESRALNNPLDFCLYVALFPQLIAGPIVRYHLIERELRSRSIATEDVYYGSLRFLYGLTKKVVVADSAGAVAEAAFSLPASEITTATAWLGALAYTIQIYFDFSAYSDMAIGLGRILGFRFPENFNRPYSAYSVTDFWRRWHMTLSNFFRDYVYIPMGGSRVTSMRMYFNLGLVFLLTGIWHGANWTFVLWGVYHGILLVIERVSNQRVTTARPVSGIFRRAITLILVVVGWVLFRSDDVQEAAAFYLAMFAMDNWTLAPEVLRTLTNKNAAILLLACLVFVLPGSFSGFRWLFIADNSLVIKWTKFAGFFLLVVPYCILQVFAGTFSPFLYFQF